MTSKPEEKTYSESLSELKSAWLELFLNVGHMFKLDKLMKKRMASKGQEVYAVIKMGFKARAVCNNPFSQPEFKLFGDIAEIHSIMANEEDAIRIAEQLNEQNSIYQYEVHEYELG